jgi:hypothetical protein
MTNLFENSGAWFSRDQKHRLYLWRIWDDTKPFLMVIGLNPSTANADSDDPTIRKLKAIAKHNGFGGFYMTNLFTFISTDPKKLDIINGNHETADQVLNDIRKLAETVLIAWGNFDVMGRDQEVLRMFPNAVALKTNKNGNPKHPLYCKNDSRFVNYDTLS